MSTAATSHETTLGSFVRDTAHEAAKFRSPVHCFYATTPSCIPIKRETKWNDNIDLGLDLLH